MKLNEIDKQLTTDDLEALETFADRIFAKVGIDVTIPTGVDKKKYEVVKYKKVDVDDYLR